MGRAPRLPRHTLLSFPRDSVTESDLAGEVLELARVFYPLYCEALLSGRTEPVSLTLASAHSPLYTAAMIEHHKAHNKLSQRSYKAMDQLIRAMEYLPGGVIFWRLLPKQGLKSRRRVRIQFAKMLTAHFFPNTLLRALVKAAVDPLGKVDARGAGLYKWLVKTVYCGDDAAFYKDWMEVR